MKNRTEMNELYTKMCELATANSVDVTWMMESGGVVIKRDGSAKLTFSLRGDPDQCKKDVVVLKNKFTEILKGQQFKFSVSNQLDTFRPEYRLIVTIL